jgi:general secretion pathway protein C
MRSIDPINDNRAMKARLLAFVIWAAVAASVVFWVMRVVTKSPGAPPYTNPISGAGGAGGDLSRVLGAPKVQVAAAAESAPQSSRFQLLGVVAPKSSASLQGVALIAIDGKPARAFRVGALVDGEWVVQSVHSRGAALGPREGAAGMRLALPPLSVAATGTLPAPVNRYTPLPVVPRPGGRLPPGASQGGYPQQPRTAVPEAAMPPEAQEEMPADAEGEPDAEPAQNGPN